MISQELKMEIYDCSIPKFKIQLNSRPNYENGSKKLRKRGEIEIQKNSLQIQQLQKQQNHVWRLRVQNTQEYNKEQRNLQYRSNSINENQKSFGSEKCIKLIYSTPQKSIKQQRMQNQLNKVGLISRSIDSKHINQSINEKNQIFKRRTLRLSLI